MKQIPKKLSGFALKYIAMVSMLCDHANMLVIRRGFFAPFRGEDGSTLIPQNAPAWLGAVQGVYRVFDVLGHLAFPLYVFLLAEGFTHTRDRKRYFLTLLAFALVSEPVFNLAHYEQWTGPALQNVLFTLSLSCLELFVLARIESDAAERGKRIALYVLSCLVFGAAAFAVRSEYVFLGTLSAALFYLLRSAGVWRLAGLLPLLIASITATTIAFVFRGFDPIIAVTLTAADAFELRQIPMFILLGVLCGGMSYYFTTVNSRIGAFYKRLPSQGRKWLYAGITLGVLLFVFPPLYGEGYEGFTSLMHGDTRSLFNTSLFYRFSDIDWVVILYVAAIMFFKVVAMSSTNAAGGVGGTFAPSLFVGAFSGAIVALLFNALFGWHLSIASFTLVGMAGVMSGVMKAPLTSIFLIAELSSGYGLFIPLMIVACISFAVDYYLDPDSIYTKQLRLSGDLLTHDKDQSVFVFLKLEELMETDFYRIRETFTLGDIVHVISHARRNIFPVIDDFGRLIGVVQLDDLREDMFKREKWGTPIGRYMIQPPDRILEHEQIQSVLPKFEENQTWMLPVVDKQNHYLGFISKSRILNAYREQLVKIQQ